MGTGHVSPVRCSVGPFYREMGPGHQIQLYKPKLMSLWDRVVFTKQDCYILLLPWKPLEKLGDLPGKPLEK